MVDRRARVGLRARTEVTAEKKARYLSAVGRAGTLTSGCMAAGVTHSTVYGWREHDDDFKLAEQQARNAFADNLEQEAVRRAWTGVKKPVFQQGVKVGEVTEYSDVLLIFMLKGVRPEKYRERVSVAGDPAVEKIALELGLSAKDVLAEMARLDGRGGN
jgi:hypothetical protein